MAEKRRYSIATRIFLGFAVLMVAFSAVATTSLVQHYRIEARLRLLHEGYLPLALTLGEVRATQAVYGNMLDRLLRETDPTATRRSIDAARRVRPTTLSRASDGVHVALARGPGGEDRQALETVERALGDVRQIYARSESSYETLFRALERGEEGRTEAERVLAETRAQEHSVQRNLRMAWSTLQERIDEAVRETVAQERRGAILLGALALVVLAVGGVLAWWARRLLAPLRLLQERVATVARGDLARQFGPRVDDEIGRVAAEFERMVEALAARDARLREASDAQRRTERLVAIGRMAALVTHEVRNPLSSIGLNVELLDDEMSAHGGAEAKALVKSIQQEVDRLTEITDHYLRLGRLPTPQLEPGDIGEVVRAVEQFVRRESETRKVELHVAVETGLSAVAFDEAQLRQALLNLLRNAYEAMPQGGHAYVEVRRQDSGVLLRVRDEGPGIAEADREKIFDLFYTTKERGTGLGLPLTQQIVLAHNGTLRCTGAFGGGACFELWLPFVPEPAAKRSGAEAERAGSHAIQS